MTCKKFFRHLSNSCYESLPVFSIKAIKAFRALSDLIARYRHAINKVNLTTTFEPSRVYHPDRSLLALLLRLPLDPVHLQVISLPGGYRGTKLDEAYFALRTLCGHPSGPKVQLRIEPFRDALEYCGPNTQY